MKSVFESTVAAISTPRGRGGVALIRISGGNATEIASAFIFPKDKKPLREKEANRLFLADIKDGSGLIIDEALVSVFRAPRSFTGEDTVEINCHGGVLVTEEILSRAFACGAEPAGPGEFTRRAFVSGKLSLSEAEAIAGIIDAGTVSGLRLMRRCASGKLNRSVCAIYNRLKDLLVGIYASVDFPDDGIEPVGRDVIIKEISSAVASTEELVASYREGHAVCEGIRTVICGKPNAGKSTLLNLLAGEQRAIVTDIPGTTRDVITEKLCCGDITLSLSDTAGIRDSSDIVEKLGIERALKAINEAELVLAVFDGSSLPDESDIKVAEECSRCLTEGAEVIAVINKEDKGTLPEVLALTDKLPHKVVLSANDDKSAGELKEKITSVVLGGGISSGDGAVIINARQFAAAQNALESMKSALTALDAAGEAAACSELENAMKRLGELDGREVSEDIVGGIFSRFCVGK